MTKLAPIAGQMVFESSDFVVIGGGKNLLDPGLWYEIADKRTSELVFLHGPMAKFLANMVMTWQVHTPIQEEVDAFLDGLTALGRTSLRTDN